MTEMLVLEWIIQVARTGTSKHHEEGIPLRIYFVAMPVLES